MNLLIKDWSAAVNARDSQSSTPLHMACYWGHMDIAAALISAGADIKARTEQNGGSSCLHQACGSGNLELVKLLIHSGADVNDLDGTGYNAVQRAKTAEIVDYINGLGK